MAIGKYVITQAYTIPAGTATAVAGGFGTVSWAGASGAYSDGLNQTFVQGQVIVLDSAGALYTLLNTAAVLRPYVQGQDDVGHAALAN